jgi:CelD/BcsL family acetyltransferase involved in cellulose biosynthesis
MSVAIHSLERTNHTETVAPTQSNRTNAASFPSTKHPTPSNLTIDIINNPDKFDALQTEWTALHDANHTNQLAFQSHAWLRAWFAAYRPEVESHSTTTAIIIARTDGKLRLACPFAIRHVLGMTCLTWLGEPASQYGDILTDGSQATHNLIDLALSFALDQLQPDIVHLRKVRNDAAVLPWIKSQDALATATDEAPYLDLHGASSFDDYCSKYSGKSRKNRRRLRRRLEEIDTVTTTILPAGHEAQVAIRTGVTFKQAWLVERGHISSALRDKHMSDFLTEVVSQPCSDANPFISVMHCGVKPVSVQFGVIAQHRLALHMIAYNPETEKSGAGVLHIEDTIAYSIENGLSQIDFLAPNAPYKQAWADATVPVLDYVFSRSLRGRLYAQAYLRYTRNILKMRVQTLPLGIRQSLARRLHK